MTHRPERCLRGVALFAVAMLAACSPMRNAPVARPSPPTPPPFVERSFALLRDANFNVKAGRVAVSVSGSKVVVTYVPDTGLTGSTRITYSRARKTLFDRPVADEAPVSVAIVGTHVTKNPLVVVKTSTLGAHCCIGSVVVDAESDTDVHVRRDDWGDGDFEIRRGTATKDPVLVGEQAAAPYAFGPFSGTAFVVKVVRYKNGELIDAAKSYPDIVFADARRHLADYLHEGAGDRPIGKSSLVAYMIDMCRVGRCDEGWKKLRDVYGEDDRPQFLAAVVDILKRYGTATPRPAASTAADFPQR
jgi:hypothetical protein